MLNSFLFLHFIATGKFELLGILVLSRWRNIGIQAPHIQNPVRFRRFNIVQTSRSRGQHLCSKFAKIPHLGYPRTFKVPTSSRGPPFGHNIDSCTMAAKETNYPPLPLGLPSGPLSPVRDWQRGHAHCLFLLRFSVLDQDLQRFPRLL